MSIQLARLINYFEKLLKDDDRLVVVYYYADWSAICRDFLLGFAKLPNAYADVALFVKVDIESASDIVAKYPIKCVPTVLYFKNGAQIDESFGFIKVSNVEDKIKELTVE